MGPQASLVWPRGGRFQQAVGAALLCAAAVGCDGGEARRTARQALEARYERGAALLAADRFDEAYVELRAAIDAAPDHARAQEALGQVLVGLGDLRAAAAAFERARVAGGASAELLHALGHVREQLGDDIAARDLYQAALSKRPTFAASHLRLAQVLERAGEHAASEAAWQQFYRWSAAEGQRDEARKAVAAAPEDRARFVRLMTQELELAHFDEVLVLAARVLTRAPEDYDAQLLGGVAAGALGRADDARRMLAGAARVAPREPRPHVELAYVLAADGDGPAALAAMREARERGASAFEEGLLARELGEFGRALACFDEQLAHEPGHVDALLAKGEVLAGRALWSDAAEAYRAALALAPEHTGAQASLEYVQERLREAPR